MSAEYGKSGVLLGWFETITTHRGKRARVYVPRRERDVMLDVLVRMHSETDEHPDVMTLDEASIFLDAMDAPSQQQLLEIAQ